MFQEKFAKRIIRSHKSKIPKGGNQKPYIDGHTIQWPKEKRQTMIYKTPKKLRCSGMVSSSCSTSGTKLSPVFQWFELSGG
jgi:hypothetical protein